VLCHFDGTPRVLRISAAHRVVVQTAAIFFVAHPPFVAVRIAVDELRADRGADDSDGHPYIPPGTKPIGYPIRAPAIDHLERWTQAATFPKKEPLWASRRYWPALRRWFDERYGALRPQSIRATPFAIAKTSTLRPAGEWERALNRPQHVSGPMPQLGQKRRFHPLLMTSDLSP